MTYFRARRTRPRIGDVISTACRFEQKTDDGHKWVHALLEETKPAGFPSRLDCLFLFEDKSEAEYYLSKMGGNFIATVEIGAVLHRGDMELVNELSRRAPDDPANRELAERYWRGEASNRPVWETMVHEGQCIDVLEYDRAALMQIMRARGNIKSIKDVSNDDFDRMIFGEAFDEERDED